MPASPRRRVAIVVLVLANAVLLALLGTSERIAPSLVGLTLAIELLIALERRLAPAVLTAFLCIELALLVLIPPASAGAPQPPPRGEQAATVHPVPVATAIGDAIVMAGASDIAVGALGTIQGFLRPVPPGGFVSGDLVVRAYLSRGPGYAVDLVGATKPSETGAWVIPPVAFRAATVMSESRVTLALVAGTALPEVSDFNDLTAREASITTLQLRVRRPRLTLGMVCGQTFDDLGALPLCSPLFLSGRAEDVLGDDRERLCLEVEGRGARGPFRVVAFGAVRGDAWAVEISDRAELREARKYAIRIGLVPIDFEGETCGEFPTQLLLAWRPAGRAD